MIRVYDSSEKLFNNNGIKILHPLSAIVFKEDNGDYYIEVEDSIEKVDYYQAGMIINCPTPFPEGNQSFRIVKIEKTNTRIKVKANHVYFDTDNYMIDDKYIVDKDCNYALDYLNKNCDVESPFTTNSDVTSTNSYRCVRKLLSEAITTLIDRWGGHLVRDNFNISIKQNIGVDRGMVVKYRKNITSIKAEEVWDNVVTKIMPVGKDGLLLPEKYLEVKDKLYDIPFSKIVKIDQNLEQEENESDEDFTERLIADLRLKAQSYLEENKYPKVNYNLSANLDNITDVGDTIYVDHPKLNIKMTTNVISVKWDVISKKYKNIEFGNFRNKLKDLLKNMNTIASEISKDNSNKTKSFLEKELIDATNKIWGTLGNSFVIYEGDKILIVDKLPKEKAKNVILMNNGGIGFSNTGINGTFATAWTIDGGFNANFITSGKIDTSLIEGYDNLALSVNKLVDVTRTLTANNYIEIKDAVKGSVLYLSIKGNLSLLFLSNQTFLGSNTFFKNSNLIIEDINGNKREIKTNLKRLNVLNDIYDEFIVDYTGTYIIRRIGVNDDLSLYELDEENREELPLLKIELNEGYNKIYLKSFSDLTYTLKYAKKNDYTDIFTTRIEMNSSIALNNENIDLKLLKKTDNDSIIAQINMSTEKSEDGSLIQIESDKLNIKNKKFNLLSDEIEIVSPYFSVSKEGKITSISGSIGGFNLTPKSFEAGMYGKKEYTSEDKNKVYAYLRGEVELTEEEKTLYDADDNGIIDDDDANLITELAYYNVSKNNPFKFIIDSQDITSPIRILDNEGNEKIIIGPWHSNLGGLVSAAAIKSQNFNTDACNTTILLVRDNATINGNLNVKGTKNRVVKTDSYGYRLLNAYETATPFFGDIGTNKTNAEGYCKIDIENIFKETIETDDYKVFIQKNGEGTLYVKKYAEYFEVIGSPNLAFDWELKAIQKGYKDIRLKKFEEEKEVKVNGNNSKERI